MFEHKTTMFGTFSTHLLPFQEVQHSNFCSVQEKPERFCLLNRRKTSGFKGVSGTQPSEKSTTKHHGSIVNGISKAFEHLPRPENSPVLLKKGLQMQHAFASRRHSDHLKAENLQATFGPS